MRSKQNDDGFIVFWAGGSCPLDSEALGQWYFDYDIAINHAISLVRKYCYKDGAYDVIVYKAKEEVLHTNHSIPWRDVVFKWANYKERVER